MRRLAQEVAAAQVAVKCLLAEQKLEALVVLHQPGVGHTRLEQLLLQLASSATSSILDLEYLDLILGKLEAEILDDLVLLEDELRVVARVAALDRIGRCKVLEVLRGVAARRVVAEARCRKCQC